MSVTHVVFNLRYEALLARLGLREVPDFLRCPMERVRSRSLEWTIGDLALGEGASPERFILKVFFPLQPIALDRGTQSPATIEYENLTVLEKMGVEAPQSVACGEEIVRGKLCGAFVVTRDAPDALSWSEALSGATSTPVARLLADRSQRLAAITLCAGTIRRMHAAGFLHNHLTFNSIRWTVREGRLACIITNCHGARKRAAGRVSPAEAERDLATLLSDGRGVLSATDALRLLTSYSAAPRADKAFVRRITALRREIILAAAQRMVRTRDLPGMPMSFSAPGDTRVNFHDRALYELNIRKLAEYETLLHHEGDERLTTHPHRRAIRVLGGPGQMDIVVKADLTLPIGKKLLWLLSGGRRETWAMHEWRLLHDFSSCMIGVPAPLGIAQRRICKMPVSSLLVLAQLSESVARLDRIVPDEATWDAIASVIARMHAAGLVHCDLYAKHILIDRDRKGPAGYNVKVSLVDLQRAQRPSHITLADRAADLAALRATVPLEVLSLVAWNAFLKRYHGARKTSVLLSDLKHAVAAQQGKLARRRRIIRMVSEWGGRHSPLPALPLEQKIAGIADHLPEAHLIHRDYQDALTRANLISLLDFFYCEDADVLRRRDGRANAVLRIEIDGRTVNFFLKRHDPVSLRQGVFQFLRERRVLSPGMRECRNVEILRRLGIRSVPVVAAGEDVKPFWQRRSYFLSRELEGAMPLDDYLRALAPAEKACKAEAFRLKRSIIGRVARIARRFHVHGCHHQDFYLNHFFIRPAGEDAGPDADPFELFLIDLQRMRRMRRLRGRWIIKDLGQLNYSADRAALSRADRLRFLLAYLDVSLLDSSNRRFLRRILAKTGRIARHARRKKK